MLQSDFAESSVAPTPKGLPPIESTGKFSYCEPIVPKRNKERDDLVSNYRGALSSIQYMDSEYEVGRGIVDFKFPELSA